MNQEYMTLYDRMNGDKIFPEVLKVLHKKIMADPLLSPHFKELPPEKQIEHQKHLINYAMQSAHKWPGRTFRQKHAKNHLDDKHFDTILGHLVASLEELDVPEHFIDEAKRTVELTRSEILNKPRFQNY